MTIGYDIRLHRMLNSLKIVLLGILLPTVLLASDPLDTLLKKHVYVGEAKGIQSAFVDYDAWLVDPLHEQAMAQIQSTDPATLSPSEQMAFWINAYNLLTIDLILQTGERESIRNQGGWFQSPWNRFSWTVNGQSVTLDHIEHEILRPMGDARIHMAIVCASLSCPDLRGEAYVGERLDEQLDEQVIVFLANVQKGMRVTNEGVRVSKIFDWFGEDFGSEVELLAFLQKYGPEMQAPLPQKIEGYFSYYWELNSD